MDEDQIEHMARQASELGDTETEALCDQALAGDADPMLLVEIAENDSRYAVWMARGVNLGWMSRSEP